MSGNERIIRLRPRRETPRLSIATPFFRHDPSPLLRALIHAPVDIEVVLIDDGSGSAALLSRVLRACERITCPVALIIADRNRGRAQARNRLMEEARGGYILFLDADMQPTRADFIDRWLDVIEDARPAVAFGGFSAATTHSRAQSLHSRLARGDCPPAAERARDPARFVATSNLLVRRDIAAATPFDPTFKGWGWEDVEWALRAAERAPITHIDNPAAHSGLDDVGVLLRKYAEAGPNFARLARRHPQAVRRFRAWRAANLMGKLPRTPIAQLSALIARDPLGVAPMRARAAALKVYRAAMAGEHLA